MKQYFSAVMIYCLFTTLIQAQKITRQDYERAVSFRYDNLNNKTVFNLDTAVNWFKDGSGLWFIDYSKNGKAYKAVDFKKGRVADLFDHEKLAKVLGEFTKEVLESGGLELSDFQRTKKSLSFGFKGETYLVDLKTYNLELQKRNKQTKENPFESKSPDGKWVAYTKDYNLFVKSVDTGVAHQLSTNGEKGYEYASWYGWTDKMEGENGERPKKFYADWSEDSKWIITSIVDTRNAEKMYLLDWSIDSLYRPKLLSYYRGSPGDATMVKIAPVFYNVDTKKEVKTELPIGTHINSVSIRKSEMPGKLFASYSERGYLKQYVKWVDLSSQKEEILIEETSDTGIDNFEYRTLEDKQKIIFLSERTGWRQLHILDLKTKETKQLSSGNFYVNRIAHIDEAHETIYFLGSGNEKDNNPYHQQLYKVNFNGKQILLTPENAHHTVSFSENGKYFTDNYSTVATPTKTVLRDSKTGKIITELTRADVSQVESSGWKAPETFSLTAKDGKTTIYGAFWKPSNFDPAKSYPIIDHSYTGPHTQVFPKTFNQSFANQSLAELGFIVVRVDGLGTFGRSKAFQDHSYKNMENNLEDHVLAIKYLAKTYAWIDINRVGIFGHSAGGYDTGRALLGFPDFYKVGVASSADHDFRMEKAWWPEMYQGWPVDETYQKVSNITNAGNLKGKLLLTHGGIDENVNPSATFKLAEALIKADKDFDLLILPSQRHGYTGAHSNYFIKKRWNYFVEHLLGTEPIWDFKWE